jgi:lactate 2-monooxygenase
VGNEYTLSIMRRAKQNGFTALVITLDTMLLGWRPHDLGTSYLPFLHGVGAQVGLSDPVFMGHYGEAPIRDVPEYPYDPEKVERRLREGDEKTKKTVHYAVEWMKQTNSGTFRTWDDLRFVRENWDGPLVLKGIMSVKVGKRSILVSMLCRH